MRSRQTRHCGVGLIEIQCVRKIENITAGIARRQRRESPAPFNQLQHRSVIVHQRIHERAAGISLRERRCDHRGHAQPEQGFPVHDIGVELVCRRGARRRDMLEEAAPFVEVHDEHRVRPLRPIRHRFECFIKEFVSFANVRVRMVVVARAVIQNRVARVHKGHRGERSGGRLHKKLRVEFRYSEVLRPPQREEGDIRIIVIGAHARSREPVPNGRHRGEGDGRQGRPGRAAG